MRGLPITPERWRKVEEIYHAVAEREPTARDAFLLEACGGDNDLLHEVESLLAQPSGDHSLVDPVFESAVDSKAAKIVPGATLGPYRIKARIGQGGMGEVFRATDTRLGREVAIKVCHQKFGERFQREARLISSLNHPNICTLYDVGPNYLVMEVVEGITLAERIRQGALPLDEALRVATQMAAALEEAHEKNIVHRDLKPVNVKIRPDGVVKVLDFGLAKERRDLPGETATIDDTQTGVVMGTPAYMAPEQAKGQPVDKTGDVWAFGVVLYEMLTGERLFQGNSTAVILSAVLHQEPDLERVPTKVRRLLRSCLEKDPARRFRHIGDIALLLESSDGREPVARWKWWLAVAATALVLVAVLLVTQWRGFTRTAAPPLMRLNVDLGTDVPLDPARTMVEVSPDGTRLAFASQGRLFTRRLDQLKAVELAVGPNAFLPFFSPDGQWIAFSTGLQLKKVPVAGGEPVTLCAYPGGGGGSWGEDGSIVINIKGGLGQLSSNGGIPTPITQFVGGELAHNWPQILPGGKAVLFTTHTGFNGFNSANVEVVSLTDGHRTVLQRNGSFGRYLPSGHLVYVNRSTLFAVPFDVDKLQARGTPVPILEGINFDTQNGFSNFGFSRGLSGTGMVVYQESDRVTGLGTVQWLDAAGKIQPLLAKPGIYSRLSLSQDGRHLALQVTDAEGSTDNWVYDHERDIMTRLTSGEGIGYTVFTPDGQYVVFERPSGLSWARSDGGGQPQDLIPSKVQRFPWSFTPDGKRLAYSESNPTSRFDIWTVPIESGPAGLRAGTPEPFLRSPTEEAQPAFSPDGRWIAYCSSETGKVQVYVRAFPDRGAKWQISDGDDGGQVPRWSRDGHQLLFRNNRATQIMAANYTVRGESFIAEKPHVWLDKKILGQGGNFDVAADGKRIAALMPVDAAGGSSPPRRAFRQDGSSFLADASPPSEPRPRSRVFLLLNFFDELRRRAPVR